MSDTISPSVTSRVPYGRDAVCPLTRRHGGPEGAITTHNIPHAGDR